MKKLSLLSLSVAVALTGCGSDDDNSSVTNPGTGVTPSPAASRFIDAEVDNLYYTDGTNSGMTSNGGEFSVENEATVTFYVGGEAGLKVGAASNRDVLSPFEASGTYDRAVNLAILLQSLDETTNNEELITLPDLSEYAVELSQINLDDRESVHSFLSETMQLEPVTEDAAVKHMTDALDGVDRGLDSPVPMFERGKGHIIREVSVSQNVRSIVPEFNYDHTQRYVHADKTASLETFDIVRDSGRWDYRLDAEELVMLKGNNDSGFSSTYAAEFLTCIEEHGEASKYVENDGERTCDGSKAEIDDKFAINNAFSYKFSNPNKATTEDEALNYSSEDPEERSSVELFMPFVLSETQAELNKVEEIAPYNDADEDDDEVSMQANIYAQSYDPVTEVLTIHEKKFSLSDDVQEGDEFDYDTVRRAVEKTKFIYQIEDQETDRYVDFIGTWVEKETCNDGQVAELKFKFDATGMIMSGTECNSGSPVTIEEEGPYSYTDLSNIDYWWFGQEGRESKATLAELNTTVRFCDSDDYKMGDVCPSDDEYFVTWTYMPAGKNLDQGYLTRRKMSPNGETRNVSSMQKID
ncbi:hypothetical protein [Vibrio agarivorans]|uniref:hypothetical protein n=1 Tax=Vibrio agarivorans TaxID=153622 RepID=UPI0025B2BE95|nr:hypothetical protein [Vibrio agarivorans]MDN3662063.1 hypothetical protein [Vibrio agarivorans]